MVGGKVEVGVKEGPVSFRDNPTRDRWKGSQGNACVKENRKMVAVIVVRVNRPVKREAVGGRGQGDVDMRVCAVGAEKCGSPCVEEGEVRVMNPIGKDASPAV